MTQDLHQAAELASDVRTSVMRLARRLRQVRDDTLDLTANQLSALGVLLNSGDQLMGELAALERVQPPSMTRIVNGLEERGLVARQPHPHDKRQCLVTLTSAGSRLLLDNRRLRDQWLTRRIAELDDDERDVLRRAVGVLDKVRG